MGGPQPRANDVDYDKNLYLKRQRNLSSAGDVGNCDAARNTRRVETRVEEVLEIRDIVPILGPLGLLAPNQVGQREERMSRPP